jgi:hypothetical protein
MPDHGEATIVPLWKYVHAGYTNDCAMDVRVCQFHVVYVTCTCSLRWCQTQRLRWK